MMMRVWWLVVDGWGLVVRGGGEMRDPSISIGTKIEARIAFRWDYVGRVVTVQPLKK